MKRSVIFCMLFFFSTLSPAQSLCDRLFTTERERSVCVSLYAINTGTLKFSDDEIVEGVKVRLLQEENEAREKADKRSEKEAARRRLSAGGPKNGIELKLLRPGLNLDDVLAMYDQFSCHTDKITNIATCSYPSLGKRSQEELNTLADQPVKGWVLTFTPESALASITISFESSAFRKVNAALTAKFGGPTKLDVKEYSNAFGAKIKGVESKWVRGDEALLLAEYAVSREVSVISLQSSKLSSRVRSASAAKTAKAAKDL